MKPIIFSTDMVRAILDGRKTQARRVVKPQPPWGEPHFNGAVWMTQPAGLMLENQPHRAGTVLWVRETTWINQEDEYGYAADEPDYKMWGYKGISSTSMLRDMARIFLKITAVRCERLQEISPEDIAAEGLPSFIHRYNEHPHNNNFGEGWLGFEWFRDLWGNINAKKGHGWDANPYVWVYEFERTEKPCRTD